MKHINEFLNEKLWTRCKGSFLASHADQIRKASRLSLKQIYAALDDYDTNVGGPVEWKVEKGGLVFTNPENNVTYNYDSDKKQWIENKPEK